jgi:tRNA threonylcarbamoyladenosine biosynthesis protein TsaB
MIILAIDTALSACSAAVLTTGNGPDRLFERVAPMARGHAEALMPLLDELLAESGVTLRDIDRFAVTVGPGTFTGVRVGVAAVRGFALATGKPAIGVNTLSAIAETARMCGAEGAILVAMDARRGEIYAQGFTACGRPLNEPVVARMEAVLDGLPDTITCVAGTAAREVFEAAAAHQRRLVAVPGIEWPSPAAVARLACTEAPICPPTPLYLRPPDARPQTGAAIARRS